MNLKGLLNNHSLARALRDAVTTVFRGKFGQWGS